MHMGFVNNPESEESQLVTHTNDHYRVMLRYQTFYVFLLYTGLQQLIR